MKMKTTSTQAMLLSSYTRCSESKCTAEYHRLLKYKCLHNWHLSTYARIKNAGTVFFYIISFDDNIYKMADP